LWDMDQRIKVMDRYGIDMQVLTLSHPMVNGLEPEEEIRLAKLANDSLAEIVQKYPGRFVGVATLPFSSTDEAIYELDRCVDTLGFKGFQISSNVNGRLLDAPELFPVYEHAAKRSLPMWIHPTTTVALDIVGTKGNADFWFGWPLDTSIAILKLVAGGVMDRLPDLKVIVHHLGAGLIPFFMSRLDRIPLELSQSPGHYWKMMYHDTANVDAHTFGFGLGVFGPDHTVFGVDYPYGPRKGEAYLESRRNILDSAHMNESDREKIYEKNARRLLNL
jgi:predicted TIM-barrel fold metal-dependent hydrolase